MSFSQHLVLWLHVAFVIFTIGPVTLAIMSTPRYIRKRDIRILRYLARMTLIFGIGSVGILIVGIVLSSMLGKTAKPWVIISETLFVVTVLLLGLIQRDQRKAIRALETAARLTGPAGPSTALAGSAAGSELPGEPASQAQPALAEPVPAQASAGAGLDQRSGAEPSAGAGQAAGQQPGTGGGEAPEAAAAIPAHMANVERGRIAMIGGVVTVIWLVVLVLMVWNG
jgi:hypothetical protein